MPKNQNNELDQESSDAAKKLMGDNTGAVATKTANKPSKSVKTEEMTKKKSGNGILNTLFGTPKARLVTFAAAFAVIGVGFVVASFASTPPRYFNPARETSRQAMASFLYRTANSPAPGADSKCGEGKSGPFKDVSGKHPFCKEIEWMSKAGITTTPSDKDFGPDVAVSRQAAAAFLYRANGSPNVSTVDQCGDKSRGGPYKDVTPTNTFCKEIVWLKTNKHMSGFSDGTFRPTESLSRQAAAVAINNIAGKPVPKNSTAVFVDVNKQHQFYNAIQWLGEKEFSIGFETKLPNIIDQPEPTTAKPNTSTTTSKPTTATTQTAAQTALAADKLAGTWHLCQGTGNDDKTRAVVSNLKGRLHEMGFKFVGLDPGTTYGTNTARAVALWRSIRWKQTPVTGVLPGCWHSPTMLAQFRYDKEHGWKFTEAQNAAEISNIYTVAAATAPTTAPAGVQITPQQVTAAGTAIGSVAVSAYNSASNNQQSTADVPDLAGWNIFPNATKGVELTGTCEWLSFTKLYEEPSRTARYCYLLRNSLGPNYTQVSWRRNIISNAGIGANKLCYFKRTADFSVGIRSNVVTCLDRYKGDASVTEIRWGDSIGSASAIYQRK